MHDFEEFRQALKQALQQGLGHRGKTGQGVFVAPIASATAMRFDCVYIVGMIEGAVPPAFRDDPLIPDSERRAAGGAAAGLPPRQEQKIKERYGFLAAMASAPVKGTLVSGGGAGRTAGQLRFSLVRGAGVSLGTISRPRLRTRVTGR